MNVQTHEKQAVPGLLQSVRTRFTGSELGLIPVIMALFAIWIVFQTINGHFLSGRNLTNLILQIAEIGMLGIGETLILLLGEIDLAIASISGVAAAVLVLLSVSGVNPWVCILAAVASGAVLGLFQGFWVNFIGVPAFIVTLAGSLGYQGIILSMLGQEGTVNILNNTLLSIATAYVPALSGWLLAILVVVAHAILVFRNRANRLTRMLAVHAISVDVARVLLVSIVSGVVVGVLNTYRGLPVSGLILLLFIGFFALLTQSTLFGRHIFAIGGNAEAARRAGINVRRVRTLVFTISGALGAVGGILGASRLGSASPASGGGNLLLDSIAAAVIGGTSLFGGRGSVMNALAGALVIGSVENGMDLLSAPSSTKYIVEGAILLIAVTIDTVTRKRRARTGR